MCVVLTNREQTSNFKNNMKEEGEKNPFSQIACAMYF